MSTLDWGVISLVVGIVFYLLGIFPKVQAILAFVGTCIVTTGWFGHILTKLVVFASNLLGTIIGKVFGIAVAGGVVLVIVLVIYFIHDLHPKNKASKRTFFVGVALAACLVAGISSFQALNGIPAGVRNGVGNASTIGG